MPVQIHWYRAYQGGQGDSSKRSRRRDHPMDWAESAKAWSHPSSRLHSFEMTVAERKRFCGKARLDDKGLKPALKQRIMDWFRDNKSKFGAS